MTWQAVKNDKAAVAGFFEDLPVLLFVLLGVVMLVISASWVSRDRSIRESEDGLAETARDIAKAVMYSIVSQYGSVPRVSTLSEMDLAGLVAAQADGRSFSVAISSLHPWARWVCSATSGAPSEAVRTGFATLLFNASDDQGLVVILEMKTIVW